ncbi:hypothetical protein Q3G72_033069 [Acer saccharum]|nr:hypothetical protein Q3G72_033069 [Acer saccharum]
MEAGKEPRTKQSPKTKDPQTQATLQHKASDLMHQIELKLKWVEEGSKLGHKWVVSQIGRGQPRSPECSAVESSPESTCFFFVGVAQSSPLLSSSLFLLLRWRLVEDKCNTTLEITSPNTSQERSIIVYEHHPPIPPKRRSRKVAGLKSPYADTELPLRRATRAWFKTLYTPDKWLNDEHIDSALYWIREVKSNSPTTKMEICTTTDILFQQNLDARFGRYTNKEDLWQPRDRLFDYANGVSPKFATPWVETDKVYIPLDYESNHWILAEVDFIAKNHCSPEIHHREDMTPWLVERCANVPQQEKSDCRVFVIKFAEYLIYGESINTVQAEKAKYFRQQLCLNLWQSRKAL